MALLSVLQSQVTTPVVGRRKKAINEEQLGPQLIKFFK
jgi:hypothetical protein